MEDYTGKKKLVTKHTGANEFLKNMKIKSNFH